jgi:superfamily I DNA/RNA helicase
MTKGRFGTKATPKQQEAIESTEGPLLIIAGPGSGKTFTLVERVVSLLLRKGATPESPFVATFTDKAAQELRTRVSSRLAEVGVRFNLKEMYLGTFHSTCLRWLRDYRSSSAAFPTMRSDPHVSAMAHSEPAGLVGSALIPWTEEKELPTWLAFH